MARHADEQAVQVLKAKLAETDGQIGPALKDLAAGARALLDLLEREDALRRAVEVVAGEDSATTVPWQGPRSRLSRFEGRVRRGTAELLEAVHQLERARAAPGLFDPVGRAPVGRAPVGRDPMGRGPMGRDPVGRAFMRTPSRDAAHLPMPSPSIGEIATGLVGGHPGTRIAVRDIAQQMMDSEPGRYADMRSAYGAVYAHLTRNPHFEKAESGVFIYVGDENNDVAPAPTDAEGG